MKEIRDLPDGADRAHFLPQHAVPVTGQGVGGIFVRHFNELLLHAPPWNAYCHFTAALSAQPFLQELHVGGFHFQHKFFGDKRRPRIIL